MSASVVETDGRAIVLDLSTGARLLGEPIAGLDVAALSELIDRAMSDAGTGFAFGRYAEPRELYTSEHFGVPGSSERRTIHMGIDLFCASDTTVRAPHRGKVAYLTNRTGDLDYGPMVILRHTHEAGHEFFTLYGHLSLDTLANLTVGQIVRAGEKIARVGAPPSNGNWPPHLHFQVVRDLLDLGAGFPGVARKSEREYWLSLSPCPAEYFPEYDPEQLEYREKNQGRADI
jgi:murein DD-endopeptidase MepM/ murein hydrolase activator NlpD